MVLRTRVLHARADAGRGHLPHRHRVGVLAEAGLVELAQVGVDERAIGVGGPVIDPDRGILERLGLADEVDDVEAERLHAPGAPEVDDLGGAGAHLGVVPVEVGLTGVEEVEVVLARERAPVLINGPEGRPGRPAELGDPVGGQGAVRLGRTDVEVVAVALLPGQCPLEPLVLGRGVIEDHVEHDAAPVGLQGGDEVVEVLQGAHVRVDGAVVGHVIAVVLARRGEEGVEPDVVDAEGGDVGDLLDDSAQVTDAVARGIAEGSRIDLIDNGVFEGHGFPWDRAGPASRAPAHLCI